MAAKSARKSTVKRKETPEQKAAKTASQDHKSRRGRGRQGYRSSCSKSALIAAVDHLEGEARLSTPIDGPRRPHGSQISKEINS
jgi:hypothetical protein